MTRFPIWRGVAVAAVLATSAVPANAVIRTAIYTGTLAWGFDEFGTLGTVHADLAGLAYTVRYKYDTLLGTRSGTPGIADQLVGGIAHGNASPIVNIVVTIGGASLTLLSDAEGTAFTAFDGGTDHFGAGYVWNGQLYTQSESQTFGFTPGAPASLDTAFATSASDSAVFLFSYTTYDQATNMPVAYVAGYSDSSAPATYTVAGIPEPASWALLITGFGLIGATLRQSRRQLS